MDQNPNHLIRGHGIDADPANDPTSPMRNRSATGEHTARWPRPEQQPGSAGVLLSNEHREMPAVFGTDVPPSGLSGLLRKYAFRHSESAYRHWLPLMAADRINMFEGILHDLGKGRVPNIPAEMGIKADWKHDRQRVIIKAGFVAGAAFVALVLALRRN